MQIKRKTMQVLVQVYLPSFMFVIVSWISYLVKPEVVPGRMALLVTLFLVLVKHWWQDQSQRSGKSSVSPYNANTKWVLMFDLGDRNI